MKLSDTSKDFEEIEELSHVEEVKRALDSKVSEYFQTITNSLLSGNGSFSVKMAWNSVISKAIEQYDKKSTAYKDLFNEDNMLVFEEIDDPKVFKSDLKKDCPIIRGSLNSRMEELQEWKEDFAKANPLELLETFANFLDFQQDYVEANRDVDFNEMEDYEDFEALQQFSADEDLTLRKVIGAGIKTTIIYNLNPHFFCRSVRRTLYGLYFLTEDIHSLTHSRTSEFIMVDDNPKNSRRGSKFNFRMEHNYWYPYNLFMLYTNHIYKLVEGLLGENNIHLDKKYRFVYVNIFLEQICVLKQDSILTMMGGDQDY